MTWFITFLKAYAASWIVLLWSVLMICVGAGWMFVAILAVLPPQVRDALL